MFQSQVNIYPAPGVVGAIASMNPLAVVKAGPGGLVSGANGAAVGRFVWINYPVAGGPGIANNFCVGQPRVPDGFLSNQQQALITTWLSTNSLVIPSGMPVVAHQRGDFWAYSNLAEAAVNQKVYANLVDGQVMPGNAGAFLTNTAGNAAVISSATVASLTNYTMTINTVTSGVVAVGQLLTGPNFAPGTYIESFGTFTVAAGNGTVFLSKNVNALFTAQPISSASSEVYGGFVGTASFATNVMTVVSVTTGALVAGQLVTSASVAAGTYITSQATGTPGGIGTYNLSTTPGTITTQACTTSAWFETSWFVNSPGNVMDLIAIGVRN